ncbi:MAG: SusD/RagB family nutrient-binding outer membrane lipoprotein, partial [Maribacter sp.]
MKKYLLLLTTIAFISCSDFGDINLDSKSATVVPAETVFANATKNLVDQMTESSVNLNIFRHFSQAWAQTTYQDETNYDLVNRDIPGNHWNALYRDVLRDLVETRNILLASDEVIPAAVLNNQLAIVSILEVFTWHVLVDSFGDVPFTQALDINNVLPSYDDDATIYPAIIAQLDAAIASIATGQDGGFGDADLIYGGDM